MADQRKILVTGATGQQGGSVLRALLKEGFRVRGLTRNPDSDKAKALIHLGAEVVPGDFEDLKSLERALRDVYGAYLMGTPYEKGVETETEHGKAFVRLAADAGIEHLVYSSVGSAHLETGIPHFESKYAVEKLILDLGINATFARPVFFMENYLSPWFLPGIQEGALTMAMPGNRKMQSVTLATIGAYVAAAFKRGAAMYGKAYDLADDELTGEETAVIISEITRHEVGYNALPLEMLREQNEDWALMFEWFDKVGYSVDIPQLRNDFPEIVPVSFREWALQQNWVPETVGVK